MSLRVAFDQLGEVEVIAGVHAHGLGQAPAHGDLLVLIQEGNLDAIDFGAVLCQHSKAGVHRHMVIAITPVAFERRIEHLAEPVDDHRLLHLPQDAAVDARVVLGAPREAGECAARHHDQLPAHALDRLDLLLVGADDVVDRNARVGVEVIGAGAAGDLHAGPCPGGLERAADQLPGAAPVEAHAALRGVHRLGDAEAEVPEIVAKRDGLVPVDRRVEPGVIVGERIGDHMRGRVGDAAELRRRAFFRQHDRLAGGVRREVAVLRRQ